MAIRKATRRRRRQSQSGTLFGFAFLGICIVVAALVFSRRATPVEVVAPTVVAEYDTLQVPVPAHLVNAGTPLQKVNFTYVPFPRHQVPPGAVVDISSVLNGVARTTLPAKLPVFRQNITFNHAIGNPVIEQIPEGMRAMTIKVDATAAVEGWAGSGAIVDVLLVQKERTSVIAEKVKILSAERSVDPIAGNGSPTVPTTVTLLTTQEQTLAINTAIPLGQIRFALRGYEDRSGWGTAYFTSDRLKRGAVAAEAPQRSVKGYVSVQQDRSGERQSYAFVDGKWMPTDGIPDGFFVSKRDRG